MNKSQFEIIAKYKLRKGKMINACRDVLFGGLNNYQAETKHKCGKASVHVALRSIDECYDICERVGEANDS